MTTAAVAGFGVTMSYNSSAVGEILELSATMKDKDQIDVTSHSSTGGYEEFIASLIIRTGEFTVKCNSVKADVGQAAMVAAYTAGTANTVAIAYPDGTAIGGSAYVKSMGYDSPLTAQQTASFVLKWSGAVTIS